MKFAICICMIACSAAVAAPTTLPAPATQNSADEAWFLTRAEQFAMLIADPQQRAQAQQIIGLLETPPTLGLEAQQSFVFSEGLASQIPNAQQRQVLDDTAARLLAEDWPGAIAAVQRLNHFVGQNYMTVSAYRAIAIGQAKQGDYTAAGKTLALIQDPEVREFGMRKVIAIRTAKGDINGATANANSIENPLAKLGTICDIARIQIGAKDFDGARQNLSKAQAMLPELTAPPERNGSLWAIARVQAMLGDMDAAIATLDAIPDSPIKIDDSAIVAGELLDSGHADAARKVKAFAEAGILHVAKSGDPDTLTPIYLRLEEMEGKFNDATAALRFIAEVKSLNKSSTSRKTWLWRIATDSAKYGDIAGAIATMNEMPDGFDKANVPISIAGAYAKAGDLDSAYKTAEAIPDANNKVAAYEQIGETLSAAGDKGHAPDAFRRAAKVAESSGMIVLAQYVADSWARSGELTSLKEWLDGTSNPAEKTWICLGAVEGLRGVLNMPNGMPLNLSAQ